MVIKKALAGILAIVLILFAGCQPNNGGQADTPSTPSATQTETVDSVSVLFNMSDSLNPYKSETVLNRRLSTLLFDPLVKLNNALQPKYILAENIDLNAKVCTITLAPARFSDGTPVTAEDVVFSIKLAMEATYTAYPEQLSTVKSYTAEQDGTVKLTLSKADPYFANLLDFPILKKDSDTRVDENNISLPPIGSGRYIYDPSAKKLTANPDYISGKPPVSTVKLVNSPDSTVTDYNLGASNVDIYYTDLADGKIPPMTGNVSTVNLNNLVYLGLNMSNRRLARVKVRFALASAIDRSVVVNDAYFSYASEAKGLFNDCFEDAKGLQNLSASTDLQNVVANLTEIGYNNKDGQGFFTDDKGKTLEFKLIAYKGNANRLKAAELVTEQLNSAGFKVTLSALEWDAYIKALVNGSYDMYIAETKLLNNMDVSSIATSLGSLSYGIPDPTPTNTQKPTETKNKTQAETESSKNDTDKDIAEPSEDQTPDGEADSSGSYIPLLDKAVSALYDGKSSLVDIINAFNAEMPIIPICHRKGLCVSSPSIGNIEMSSVSDIYFGITDINKTTNGGNVK